MFYFNILSEKKVIEMKDARLLSQGAPKLNYISNTIKSLNIENYEKVDNSKPPNLLNLI